MNILFHKILELSAIASIVAVAVILLRLILKSGPKWVICSLWALVAIRLVCPVTLESPVGLMPPVSEPADVLVAEQERPELPAEVPVILPPVAPYKPNRAPDLLAWFWAFGAVTMLIWQEISYLRLKKKVEVSLRVRDNIYVCDAIHSPFVLGILWPKIYLPSLLRQEDIPYILAHEQAHIHRWDPLWKTMGFLLLSIHWFNPILWLSFVLFSRDMESACDERALKQMGREACVPYAEALLHCSRPFAYPLGFGEVGVKQRIRQVLNYRKPGFWITAAAVTALVITGACLLTSRPQTIGTFVEPVGSCDISMDFRGRVMDSPEEQDALEEFLHSVRVAPAALREPPVEGQWGLRMLYWDTGYLAFTPDFTTLGITDAEGYTEGYSVKDPEKAQAFFSTWLDKENPNLIHYVGWDQDWEDPITITHGGGSMRIPMLSGWESEEIPYTDHSTPWGLRVRPQGEEGWLFFSYWPDGLRLEEQDRYYTEGTAYGFEKTVSSFPAEAEFTGTLDFSESIWSYIRFCCSHGDYAIINQGSDSWMRREENAVMCLRLHSQFLGDPQPVEEETQEPWTRNALSKLFEENRKPQWIYRDCVSVTDFFNDYVGVVLYSEKDATGLAWLREDGSYSLLGLESLPTQPANLAYAGNGTVTFRCQTDSGEPYNVKVTTTTLEDGLNFQVETD